MPKRRTELPDPRKFPRFSGIATFARYPRLDDVATKARPVDWLVYGVPYDGGTTYRPGARFGPRAIRDESQYVKPYHVEHALDLCEVFSMADAGDAPVKPYSCKGNTEEVSQFAIGLGQHAAVAKATKFLALGGDHSIAYANIRATWERRGKPKGGLALLHVDSHLDTVDEVWGEKWGHASPFIRAVEDGLIDPARMISIGVKGPLNTREDLDYAKRQGVTIVTYERWKREGPKVLAAFLKRLKGAETYVTFDIDAVDPAFAPGTGTPSVGGFTSAEALSLVRAFAGTNIVGADVVEVLPDRDVGGITALLAAHIAFEIMCAEAARVSDKSK